MTDDIKEIRSALADLNHAIAISDPDTPGRLEMMMARQDLMASLGREGMQVLAEMDAAVQSR